MERLELRRLTRDDLDAMGQLVRAEGRNLHPDELPRFLALEGAYVVGVLRDGDLVGMITALRMFDHGWVGPVMMRGGEDAVGLSTVLAQEVVGGLQRLGVDLLYADATASEAVLLERMGFERVRRTLILERAPAKLDAPPRTQALEARHALDVGALDAAAAGYGRKEYILELAQAFPEGARVLADGEDVRGYALMRRSRRGFALGPVVTSEDDVEAAEALVADAVASAPTWPIVTLVPEGSPLLPALARLGFEEVGGLVRMRAGQREAGEGGAATEWAAGGRMTG